ncbi:MAG TPA: hypothetical protein VFW76_07590 [Ktedonobacterales bacterium]|nr:hypothetical protein [Ktedonobacterales bacterium]
MILAEPLWLHTLGQMAGTLLMLELCFVLLLVCVIVGALAYGTWWLYRNVMPILSQYGPMAQQYMGVAVQGSDRVVSGVAEFHSRWEAIATGARVMVFGTRGARRPLPPADENGDMLAPGNIPNLPAAPNPAQNLQQNGADGHAQ